MNNPDRRKQILDILAEEGEINTTVLSTRLGVTGATIRTDIRALEREGAIIRFHGGIKLPHSICLVNFLFFGHRIFLFIFYL